jgi:tartrate dehydratase beta subunit/fumarate hydratase class I family protein
MASSDAPAALMRLAPQDNVAVALRTLAAGETVLLDGATILVARDTAVGHKLAARAIAAGERIVKYNCPIGTATAAIAAGDYVHTHNVASDYLPTYTLPK